jgi:hypothetical protein
VFAKGVVVFLIILAGAVLKGALRVEDWADDATVGLAGTTGA